MKTDVLIEPVPNGYRATGLVPGAGWTVISSEGVTREEALTNFVRSASAQTPPSGEIVTVEVPGPQTQVRAADSEGWQSIQGYLEKEPLFDAWQEAIRERRRREDQEAVTSDEPS